MMSLMRFALAAMLLAAAPAAFAQAPQPRAALPPDPLQQAIQKSNAYIGLMNRTLRAVDSWNRYTSWVNVRTGPTGRERYISYGLYSLYDVRGEIEKALAATSQEPIVPELDATVRRYVETYQALAPVITRADGYYERQDYRSDNMAEGKALHAQLVPAAEAFLRERANFERQMTVFQADLDRRELAAIEAREGRSRLWHVRNVMVEARKVMDVMPSRDVPRVDMKTFDEALAGYAAAVRALDEFAQANPGRLSAFESQPRSMLGKLREYREKLARSRGDGRRVEGANWIVNDYNMMTSMSQMATRF